MYCTLEDLKKMMDEATLVQLTDDEGHGIVNQERINEAISQADAEINSYCAVKYTVPFAVVTDLVRKLSVDIALYNLYSRRVEEVPALRNDRYKNAIRQLEGISRGTVSLGQDPPPQAGTQSEKPDISGPDRTFTRNGMEDF